MPDNGKPKRRIASQVKVGFPPAFVKEHIEGKGKDLNDFKKEVMQLYKGESPVKLDQGTIDKVKEVFDLIGDPDKVSHGMNEIKFYGHADIDGRVLATKIMEVREQLNRFEDGK